MAATALVRRDAPVAVSSPSFSQTLHGSEGWPSIDFQFLLMSLHATQHPQRRRPSNRGSLEGARWFIRRILASDRALIGRPFQRPSLLVVILKRCPGVTGLYVCGVGGSR